VLTVEEAQRRVLARVPLASLERVALLDGLGRTLLEDVVSPVDLPPWDNSSMDGYAVRREDLRPDGRKLRLLEVIAAGHWPEKRVDPGTASAVMTGAPMPPGADAVVMVEDTDASLEGEVHIKVSATGNFVRRRGEEIRAGRLLLASGMVLGPAQLGLLASVGIAEVGVGRRPKVGILSTGDEVVLPGKALREGQIYSANNATLAALALEAGATVVDAGQVGDQVEPMVERLQTLEDCDLILTSGGVSVGAFDVVKEVFERLQGTIEFWRVKMKPGKPLAFGHWKGEIPWFGLPGNPVSCAVNFHQFVRPWIRMHLGDRTPYLPMVRARASEDLRESPGRQSFVRVRMEWCGEHWEFRNAGSQSSAGLPALANAHGYLVLPPDSSGVSAGEWGDVQVFRSPWN